MTQGLTNSLSVVLYRYDLTDPAAPYIFLGAIAESRSDSRGAIGVLARRRMDEESSAKLDLIARRQLEQPAQYLVEQIESVAKDFPESVLEVLAERHTWALHITTPKDFKVPEDYETGDPEEQVFGMLHQIKMGTPSLLELFALSQQPEDFADTDFEFRVEDFRAAA